MSESKRQQAAKGGVVGGCVIVQRRQPKAKAKADDELLAWRSALSLRVSSQQPRSKHRESLGMGRVRVKGWPRPYD